ncbi:hypothetical protein CAEBREN_25073 [Caenorhabditis brenneri]|uniref:DUF281 domain-containing protein n=1 Tax=Caenorhabditis brenneri TaxID=135651 RepID=G0NT13_CAEBE|nr:hypothetical protein CAEBREN_25073 [Caenorhabditis brenneri]
MLLPAVVLCTVLVAGYGHGYGNGYGNEYYESKKDHNHCKKLKHYDIAPPSGSQLNRKAKFTQLEKNGKQCIMIDCPITSHTYALIAGHDGSEFNIFGADYSDTVVLAAGVNVGLVASCDGKKITATTTDGKKVNIKKVACIQNNVSNDLNSTVTVPPAPGCNSCNFEAMKPALVTPGTDMQYVDIPVTGGCMRTQVSCIKLSDPDNPCRNIAIETSDGIEKWTVDSVAKSIDVVFVCSPDGTYSSDSSMKINKFQCVFTCGVT